MSFTYDMKDISEYSLSFTVDSGEVHWFLGGIKKGNDYITEDLKTQLPKKKIFKLNSLIYNIETQIKEMNISFDCSYNEEENSLSIIINEHINHVNLTREVALTLFLFIQKVQIKTMYFLVALNNPNYVYLLQELMTLGFKAEQTTKTTTIDGNVYKILIIETKDLSANVEECDF